MLSLATVTAPVLSAPTDVLHVVAQATKPAGSGKPWFVDLIFGPMFLPIALLILVYVFIFSSKRKQERAKQDLLSSIKRGDKILTSASIIGKVVEADEQKVLLKVDESTNTKIWFARTAVTRVLEEDKKTST